MAHGYPTLRRYKTEAGFHRAMARFGERVLEWWGDDYGWAMLVRDA